MGCGVSKDCTAEQPTSKSKKKFIHACREHLQSAIGDVSCKKTASVRNPQEYIHLRETPTLEEQGNEREEEGEGHAGDDDNAEEAICIDRREELEYLENKPPITQLLHSQHQLLRTPANVLSAASHKSPLCELTISSNGKPLDVRKDRFGASTYNASPRSNQYYSGISPSRPCPPKAKSNSCSPLNVDRVKPPPSPIQAWNPQNSHSPNFIKTLADQQLCKEADNDDIDNDPSLEVVGHSCKPVATTTATHVGNQPEEIFKSNTDAIIDGFIEDLQQEAFESNQLTSRLMAYGNLSGSPNSYMKELLEHFDKSTEPLHMPTTPRITTWQSKLLETIDRDIDNILQEQQAEVAFMSKDQGATTKHLPVDLTHYESIEL